MKLPKLIIATGLIIFSQYAIAQTHTFIGELNLGYRKYLPHGYDNSVPHALFVRDWYVRAYVEKSRGEKGPEIKSVKLLPKEAWYSTYREEIKKVELVVEIPDSLLLGPNGEVPPSGNMNLICEICRKSTNVSYGALQGVTVSWWKHKQGTDDIYYVTNNTYKLKNPVIVASPPEVGVRLALDFLKIALDSTSDEVPHFKYIVSDLDMVMHTPNPAVELSYSQFNNFSRLLIFLESFVPEEAFINQEARELYRGIQALKDSLRSSRMTDKDYENQYALSDQIKNQIELFYEYEKTIGRARKYYQSLQLILYGKQFNHRFQNEDSLKNRTRYERLEFAIGTGLLLGLNPLYNVVLREDTVRFDRISKLNTVLAAGVFWSPTKTHALYKGQYVKKDSIENLGRFSLGLLLTYSITPNSSQLPGATPFGVGLATGYRKKGFGVYLLGSIRLIRQPRQYFIDQFKDNDFGLNSLDINDNSLFINKTRVFIGMSVTYFINRMKQSGIFE